MLTRRQREILEYIKDFVERNGYAPSLEEIGERFSLRSVATVHKHLSNLIDRGMLRRGSGSRSIEVLEQPVKSVCDIPLLGRVAAGRPIEAVQRNETLSIPPTMASSRKRLYALQVQGDSMIEEGIFDGDYVVVEERSEAQNGDKVIALVDEDEATCKVYYRQGANIKLQPANANYQPMIFSEERVRVQGVVVGLLRYY
jgi:repressor LexA